MTPNPPTELSVIIASHNRRELLRRCLDSLAKQTQDLGTLEVIVADDGSTDGTAEMVGQLEPTFRLRLLKLEKGGKSSALNAGIEAAAGPVCLFLDDDIVASPELVAEHLALHREEPRAIGIGALTQQPPASRDWYAHAYAKSWNDRYEKLPDKYVDWIDCYGANLSASRAALNEVGGFSTELDAVEDLELGFRLSQIGCVPTYLPRAHGIHDDQKPRKRILAHTRRFGACCAEFARREPAMGSRPINWFTQPTARDVTLRRLFLALRLPPASLALIGRLLPGAGPRQLWFGFISRYTFWLGVRTSMSRREWVRATRGMPVLMYHAFSDDGERKRFIVGKQAFARQMRLLAMLRYRVIAFEDLVRDLREGRSPPRRTVAITIDDGYADILEVAHPILHRHAFPATIFLVSAKLSGANDWDDRIETAGRPLLSGEQIMRLRADGIQFGSHTRTHRRLSGATNDMLALEIGVSRKDLERSLEEPILTFAYPYGDLDREVVEATGAAGFLGACTVEPRLVQVGEDPLRVPRIEIRGTDSLWHFLRKLWFGGV